MSDDQTSLYRLFDKEGVLLYIGIARYFGLRRGFRDGLRESVYELRDVLLTGEAGGRGQGRENVVRHHIVSLALYPGSAHVSCV